MANPLNTPTRPGTFATTIAETATVPTSAVVYNTSGLNKSGSQPKAQYIPSLWTSAISGSLGGGLVDGLLYPLDVLKTRLQAKESRSAPLVGGLEASSVQQLARASLWRKWYPGLLPALCGSVFGYGIYFGAYSTSKRYFSERSSWMHPSIIHLISGGLAEVAASIIYVPSEVLKTRLILAPPTSSLGILMATIYREGGLRAYLKGYTVTLSRDIPYSAIQFTLYELIKKHWASGHWCQEEVSAAELQLSYKKLPLREGAAGVMAGMIAGWMTTPLDCIKTRIQGGLVPHRMTAKHGEQRVGERLRSMFRGATPRALASGLHTGILFFMFESILGMID